MTLYLTTILAADGEHRAVISRRPDGVIHVGFERWDDAVVSGIGAYNDPFWVPDGEGALVASLEAAEAAARTRLGPAVTPG
jgi:hypothetical protein